MTAWEHQSVDGVRFIERVGPPNYTGSSGDEDLILSGLDESLLTAATIAVTLAFEKAGEVTVDAVVSAPLRLTLDRYRREVKAGDL